MHAVTLCAPSAPSASRARRSCGRAHSSFARPAPGPAALSPVRGRLASRRSLAPGARELRAALRRAAPALAGRGATPLEAKVKFTYTQIEVPTKLGIALFDITPQINEAVAAAGITEGTVNVLSRHTTTAVTINECEGRLIDDVRQYLVKLAPPDHPYLHNDIHLRDGPEDWPGGNEAWRAQEPVNAHSHLLSMLLGNSETIPVSKGKLCIGTWQSVILVELDGPRTRTVGIQVVGQA